MVLAALFMAFQPSFEVLHSRCAPSLLLCAAVVAEVGGALDWSSIIAVILALVGGAAYKKLRYGASEVSALVSALALALGFVVIVPVLWAVSRPVRSKPPARLS